MTAGSDTERDAPATSERRSPGADRESGLLDEVGARFAELRKEFREYLAIETAMLRLAFWKAVVAIVSAAVAAAVAIAFAATACVFVLSGLTGWLGEATSKPYLGSLLAGLIGLSLVSVVLLVARVILMRKAGRTKDADQGHRKTAGPPGGET